MLSHETALDLHRLSDVNPAEIHVTVPREHRVQRRVPGLYVLHRADLDAGDIMAVEGIPVVTPVRAVHDCAATGLGPALIEQAIEDGRRRGVFTERDAERLRRDTRLESVA